jgi:hypothetical protein
MKSNALIFACLLSWGIICHAAPDASPALPEALTSLKAKLGPVPGWKGQVLALKAEAPLGADQWKAIEGLGVHSFSLDGKGVDNDAFARLVRADPEAIATNGTALTDEGFRALASMKSLRVLTVIHTLNVKDGFTGVGFAQLKALPKLEKLTLAGTGCREQAFEAIGELAQLKDFSTWHSQYGDPLHPYLPKLRNLESLRLGNSLKRFDGKPRQLCLTDATLATLAQVTSLKSLNLMQAKLSLSALLQLKALPNLASLRLDDVDLNEVDYARLRAALPKVKVAGKPLTDAARAKLEEFLR